MWPRLGTDGLTELNCGLHQVVVSEPYLSLSCCSETDTTLKAQQLYAAATNLVADKRFQKPNRRLA